MVFHLCILCNYCWLGVKPLSFDTVVKPCAFPLSREPCSWSLQVHSLSSNSLSGKTFQKLAPSPLKALAYLQIMSSRIHRSEENRPQSEQNKLNHSVCILKRCRSYVWILVSISSLFTCIRSWCSSSKETRARPLLSHPFLCSFPFGFRLL